MAAGEESRKLLCVCGKHHGTFIVAGLQIECRHCHEKTIVPFTLRDLPDERVLWNQSGLLFREQYDVPEAESDFFDRETLALDEIAKGAAGALVTSILEGF